MHCEDPGCLKACPSPGAIVQYTNGIVDFHEENCIGCGYCITGCPFNVPRISKKDHKAYKCTLCSDRVAVGLEPACVKTCPTGAIVFGTKEDMKQHAAERIEDLKERGFENAGSVRSRRRGRHARDVRAASCRPAGALSRLAGGSAHQPDGAAVEGIREAAGAGRHGVGGAGWVLPLHAGRSERDGRWGWKPPTQPTSAPVARERSEKHHERTSVGHSTGETGQGSPHRLDTIVATRRTSAPITGSPRSRSCCWRCPGSRCFIRPCSG